ncbi:DUF3772 domain-containing protein [Microvirga sp. W0021]|uniref:DUF3772 domain-containing protein n=1 Tax=Hohaiivirga grylli TaxID=3133970 RepID=A0ABV0BM31_9HYPH
MSYLRRFWLCSFLILSLIGLTPNAFGAGVETSATTIAPTVDAKTIRSSFEKYKATLDTIEKALTNDTLSDSQMQNAREQISPIVDDIQLSLTTITPRITTTKARLDQLGPKPKDATTEESPEVANERTEKETLFADLTETQRLGNVTLVQATQLLTELSDKRRALFQKQIFQKSNSIVSPDLWINVLSYIPEEITTTKAVLSSWLYELKSNASLATTLLFCFAASIWLLLFAARPLFAGKLIKRDPAVEGLTHQRKILAAIAVVLFRTVPAAIGAIAIYSAVQHTTWVPDRLSIVVATVLISIVSFAFVNALSNAVLSPKNRPWRLVSMADSTAARLRHYILLIAAVFIIGKIADSFYQAFEVALPISVASKGVFSIAVAVLLMMLLLHFAIAGRINEESLAAYSAAEMEIGGPLRMIGWLLIISIIGTALFGYIALSSFLVDQAVWLAVLFTVLRMFLSFINEHMNAHTATSGKFSLFLQANTGLTKSSLEQLAVILNGLLRVSLIIIAATLALAPWGIESLDYTALARSAFFGFQVGEMTISISLIVMAIGLFVLGIIITRLIQRWLDTTYLPATKLDAGLRNSIKTGVGYIGFIIAAFATLSYAGISLSNITIVAGALSVGVGFGLQSIVNNFVSGLILLWERPIRVGDLVVVGDGEGNVRRINVRSTEIVTSDRTTIIVPNSNLISGVVRNRVRGDRMNRIVIAIPVDRTIDPDLLATIVKKCALDNRDVASSPPPNVLFKKIAESNLYFELVCFVEEIEITSRVSSELHFAIFRALREAGIITSASPTQIQLQGLEPVADSINNLAGQR